MIQEITQRHYSGVLCSRGKERIPAPKRAVALYEEIKHGEGTMGKRPVSRIHAPKQDLR
jgi:hypothetical protein